jgi:hypothetical protein
MALPRGERNWERDPRKLDDVYAKRANEIAEKYGNRRGKQNLDELI